MKILALGDPHGKLPKNIISLMKKVDLIVCVGDIPYTPKNPLKEESWTKKVKAKANKSYSEIIKKLNSSKKPLLTLRGNMFAKSKESNKLTKRAFSKHKDLYHKKFGKLKILNQNFIFYDILYEPHNLRKKSSEKRFKSNKVKEKNLNKQLKSIDDPIIISHAPPYGYLDVVNNKLTNFKKKHVGSKILLKAIKKHKPKLVLCGHIHEAKGKKKIGKTGVYNLGSHGDYKIIEVKQ
ncbi:MAG: metallophosphoesterase [archaeon]